MSAFREKENIGVTTVTVCKAPWGLRLRCKFVHLIDCEMTEIITSFTIYQEIQARAAAGSSRLGSSRSSQEKGEDHKLRWCLT